MGKIKQIEIGRFDGGIAFDNRMANQSQFTTATNFDVFKKPSTLSPIRGIESDQNFSGADGFKQYKAAAFGQSFRGGTVYAWGRKSNTDTGVKLYQKGATGTTWTASTDGSAAAVEENSGAPVPNTNIITTFDSSGESILWSIVNNNDSLSSGTRHVALISFKTGVATSLFKKALYASSVVNAQGIEQFLILGRDGNGYVFDLNRVHRLNASDGSVTDEVLKYSPSSWQATAACQYQSYVAIALRGYTRCRVALWDYVDTQESESIDFGEGTIVALQNINGVLVAVIDKNINTSLSGTSMSNGQGSMQVKVWSGGTVQTVTEIKAGGILAGATKQYSFVRNNVMYWYAKIPTNEAATEFLEGIWGFGRVTDSQPWAISLHRIPPTNMITFHMQGDYTYFAHGTDGSVSRTYDTDTYDLTSTYETIILDGGASYEEKQFIEARVSFEKLTSGQGVVLKYRKNGDTSWTTVNPVPAIATGDVNAEYPMDGNFYECQFRIESTGGAKINGLKVVYEEL